MDDYLINDTFEEESSSRMDFGRAKELKYMYEHDITPEVGMEEYEPYVAYKAWADNLKMTGNDMYLKCLSCPGMFRTISADPESYNDETYFECDFDCARAYDDCDLESYGYRETLFDYYMGVD